MGYQEAFADIRADFQRYAKLIRGGGLLRRFLKFVFMNVAFCTCFGFVLPK